MTEKHNPNSESVMNFDHAGVRTQVIAGHVVGRLKPIHIPVERDGVVP